MYFRRDVRDYIDFEDERFGADYVDRYELMCEHGLWSHNDGICYSCMPEIVAIELDESWDLLTSHYFGMAFDEWGCDLELDDLEPASEVDAYSSPRFDALGLAPRLSRDRRRALCRDRRKQDHGSADAKSHRRSDHCPGFFKRQSRRRDRRQGRAIIAQAVASLIDDGHWDLELAYYCAYDSSDIDVDEFVDAPYSYADALDPFDGYPSWLDDDSDRSDRFDY